MMWGSERTWPKGVGERLDDIHAYADIQYFLTYLQKEHPRVTKTTLTQLVKIAFNELWTH